MYSIANAPCGPPKPRNAVFDCVLVLPQKPSIVDVGQPVRVVEVAQRARHHRTGQVGREAATRDHVDRHAVDHALVVVADFVRVVEIVALAGDHHVVVAVRTQLDRAQQLPCSERRAAREQTRLRFLAAETAAHAPAFDQHVVRRHAQRVRDHVLHFGRVLRRAVDVHAVVVLRHRVRNLAFQIELLLAAEQHFAGFATRARAAIFAPASPRASFIGGKTC